MELGVIADTHNRSDLCEKAIDIFNDTCNCVIHCGDFESFRIFEMFLDQRFEFKYVIGNEDVEEIHLYKNKFEETPSDVDECLDFKRNGIRIGAFHNTYPRPKDKVNVVYDAISSGEFDYFFYGHIHFFNFKFPSPDNKNKTFALNPGSFYPILKGKADNTIPTFAKINMIKKVVSVYYYFEDDFHRIFEFEIKTRKIKKINSDATEIFFGNLKSYLDMNSKNYEYWSSDCSNGNSWLNVNMKSWRDFFRL